MARPKTGTIVSSRDEEEEMLRVLCDAVESGSSLARAAEEYGRILGKEIVYASVITMFNRHPHLKARLDASRESRAHAAIDKAYAAVEAMGNRTLDGVTGTAIVNGLIKLAAKDNPRRYGERVDMTVNHGFAILTDEQIMGKLTEIVGKLPSVAPLIDADDWSEDEDDQ